MADTLPYVENQTYEGVLAKFTKSDGSDLDISTLTTATFRCYQSDYSALLFSGTYASGELAFVTNGTDGQIYYDTQATDMTPSGKYRGEFEVLLNGKLLKKQGIIIDIKKESPTT